MTFQLRKVINLNNSNWVAPFSFWFVIVNFIIFSVILALDPKLYVFLVKEDHLVESLGALLFFLCGLTLFSNAFQEFPNKIPGVIIGLMGFIFILAAGEEISWGQRIFGWETPEALKEINDQNETNFHNINKKFFDRLYERAILILLIVSLVCYFRKIKTIFHIPLPTLLMVLSFCLITFYDDKESITELSTRSGIYIFTAIGAIFLLAKRKSYPLIIYPALALIAGLSILEWNLHFVEAIRPLRNPVKEVREYLFAFCCLMLAIEMRHLIIRNKV